MHISVTIDHDVCLVQLHNALDWRIRSRYFSFPFGKEKGLAKVTFNY